MRSTEGPAVGPVENAYAGLFDGWTSFYRDMGDRLTQNLARQQKAYEELYVRWSEFTGSAAKIATDAMMDERTREAFDIWRNYGNKIGARMTRATTEGLKGFGEVSGSLDHYATRVADAGRAVTSGKFETARAEELYETWLDVLSRLRAQLDRAADMSHEELDDLLKTWLEFSSRMDALVSDWTGKEGPYAELVDMWAKRSKDMGDSLQGFVRGHDHDYEETRKAWAEHFLKMQANMGDLAKAIGVTYEDLYRRLLEGGVTSLSDFPIFPFWGAGAGHDAVGDLKRRVDQLEKSKPST